MGATATTVLGVVLYENDPREIERLVRSLESNGAEGAPPFEVRWIDNSPSRALEGTLRAVGAPGTYRHAGANLGFGAAHNRLMAEAFASGAEAYVCVNPDAVLHPGCLAELHAEAARRRRPGLVEALQFPDEHPKIYDPRTHGTPWASGCTLLVTRALYEAVGGFDERFFMYCEDVDLSWRARAEGFDVTIAPRALVHHYTGDRPPGGLRVEMMLRSAILLAAKWGGAAFGRTCAAELAARNGAPQPVHDVDPVPARHRRVADFSHMFGYAELRW